MRFIPTRVHGIIDYLMGALLIAAPWIFGFNRGGAETWVPVILGAGVILYSLFTDYELGAVRKLSMPAHLMMDVVGGIFLAVSPWLFDFDEFVYLPHLILGIAEIGTGLFTKRVPDTERTSTQGGRAATSTNTYGDRKTKGSTPASSRPPIGSNADSRTRTERERTRREREDLE